MANDRLMDHEYDGIREFDNPTPGWWHLLFWGTIVFSVSYFLFFHAGTAGWTISESYQAAVADNLRQRFAEIGELTADEATIVKYMGKPEWLAVGKSAFAANCKSCHGEDGSGAVGPNLTDNYYKRVKTLADIAAVIANGAGGGNMPAWRSRLHPNEIVLLAAFVASLRGKNLPGPRGAEGQEIPPWPTAAAERAAGPEKPAPAAGQPAATSAASKGATK